MVPGHHLLHYYYWPVFLEFLVAAGGEGTFRPALQYPNWLTGNGPKLGWVDRHDPDFATLRPHAGTSFSCFCSSSAGRRGFADRGPSALTCTLDCIAGVGGARHPQLL